MEKNWKHFGRFWGELGPFWVKNRHSQGCLKIRSYYTHIAYLTRILLHWPSQMTVCTIPGHEYKQTGQGENNGVVYRLIVVRTTSVHESVCDCIAWSALSVQKYAHKKIGAAEQHRSTPRVQGCPEQCTYIVFAHILGEFPAKKTYTHRQYKVLANPIHVVQLELVWQVCAP
jgi:hypothetical protein